MNDTDRFVDCFVNAMRDDSAAVFAGAGLSIPAGLVDWRGLMSDIAGDVGLSVGNESDLVSVAQYHVNERGGRHRINEALVTEFAERAMLTRNHTLLAGLPVRTYWTTNYDTLIENALRNAGKRVDIKHSDANLPYTLRQRDVVLYKMHGDVSQPDDAVVTRDDYEFYNVKRPLLAAALQGDLVSKTFLFIGFSFNDPNLSYVLGRIRVLLGGNRRDHYCLLRKSHRDDFRSEAEHQYALVKQDLQVRDLRRYGIHSLVVDSYDEYTEVLQKIADTFRRRRVFVSGSAATYAPLSEAEGRDLIREIGKRLIESGFDVINGFGLGVGPYLLNGALEGLGDTGSTTINDRIVLRPFPQGITNEEERRRRWREYRQLMIAESGIVVVLFGNQQKDDGDVELASGVREELTLAKEAGLVVVPVGATGYVAREAYDLMIERGGSLVAEANLRQRLTKLQQPGTTAVIAEGLIELLNLISRGT